MKKHQNKDKRNRLIDGFGREHSYLRISVTDRCNLRCFYCMPHEGIKWLDKSKLLNFDEIERLARVFVSMGVEKIRLTGGEPLVRKELPRLIARLSAIEGLKYLSMTTNAMLLAQYAEAIAEAGITHLNISLDSLKRDRLEKITGRDCFDPVMKGLEKALSIGFPSIKLNVVMIAGVNEDELFDFVEFVKDKPVNVRFIEFMPFRNNDWNIERVLSYKEMLERIETKYSLNPLEAEPSAVAKDYALTGAKGTVSFVTSMSDSFCGSCNRLRLTSDGSIKSCLFYPAEVSLRDAIREGGSDRKLEDLIQYCLGKKPEAHPPAEEIAAAENRAMIEIGG